MENFEGFRIYISPCGIGLGHVTRCNTIARVLESEGADVLFSTYLDGLEYARHRGLKVASSPSIRMANDETGSIDLKATSFTSGLTAAPTFLEQVQKELLYMRKYRPDVVLSDSRLSTIYAGKLLDVPVATILNQFQPIIPREDERSTLFKMADGIILGMISRGWGQSDVIIIPDFPEPNTISLDSLRIPRAFKDKTRFVGALLENSPDEVPESDELRERLDVRDGRKLIYAGISGPRDERIPLIRMLKELLREFPDKYRVVMSLGDPTGGMEPSRDGNLTVIPWVPDRDLYLKTCDIVLSRAGHETIMQSICYKKPSLLIPVPKHTEQYANARRAMELGVAEAIDQCKLYRGELLSQIKRLAENEVYKNRLNELNDETELCNGLSNTIETISCLIKG
ncbi:MAG: glycosyltransferase [Candidatus Bathyarchaeia archaeon]